MSNRAALYARFSTDKQRDESTEDQFRECERVAKAAGLQVVARFEDKGISGGTHQRPGYQALLAAARRHDFDIIVTEDISRLWRNRSEYGQRSAEFEDLGIHCLTCVGDDTRRDSWGLTLTIKQAMAESARREASYRTRRGLNGNAIAGKPTGGRAYGYIPATESASGQLEIDETQAAIVRRIFEQYANGMSPRNIAAQLNAEGVPSPGATWKRVKRRKDGKWLASAIHGDVTRGTGILNNRRYIGVITWGRSEWKRSAADSSIRRMRMLEQAATERTDERLRIVPPELWERVKARQELQSHDLGVRVKGGLLRTRRNPSKFLLSGSLRCSACRASFALSNGTRYQCASHHDGGDDACSVSLSVPRDRVERVFRDYMAGPELPRQLAEIEARWLAGQPVTVDYRPRIAELEKQRANLIEAIKSGGLAAELGGELKALSAELEQLKVLSKADRPMARKAVAPESIERRVAHMLERLDQGGEIAQAVVRQLFPDGIWLYPDPAGGRYLWAVAQTALPDLARHVDSNGYLPAEHWPRVYCTDTLKAAGVGKSTEKAAENLLPISGLAAGVGGSGSGGRI